MRKNALFFVCATKITRTWFVPYSFVLDVVLDAMQSFLEIIGYSPFESFFLIELLCLEIIRVSSSFVHSDERQITPEDHVLLVIILPAMQFPFDCFKIHGMGNSCQLHPTLAITGSVRFHFH